MRCHICNAILKPAEIAYSKDHDEFDPCQKCLDEIDNVFEDHLDEDQIRKEIEKEESDDEKNS